MEPPQLEVSARSAGNRRCPFCHADAVEATVRECAGCGVDQHEECWSEHGACAACGERDEDASPRRSYAPATERAGPLLRSTGPGPNSFTRGLFALQSLALLACMAGFLVGLTEEAVLGGAGLLGLVSVISLFDTLTSGGEVVRQLLGQLLLSLIGCVLVHSLVVGLDISPSDVAPSLASVALFLAIGSWILRPAADDGRRRSEIRPHSGKP